MIIGLLLFFLQKYPPLEVQIIKRQILEGIPSASGIEIVEGLIYIIGDDSPYLYCLDHNLRLINQIQLYTSDDFSTGRIPKSKKQDLECITSLVIHQQTYLFIAGSGATECRETGYLVKLPTRYNKNYIVTSIPLGNLYKLLRQNDEVVSGDGLNLEAAACTDSSFIFFNRANGKARNTALVFDIEEMVVFLYENHEYLPFPKILPYDLPSLKGIPAGFSGAAVYDKKIFITASLEDVPNAIDDGIIFGSYIGIIKFSGESAGRSRNSVNLAYEVSSMAIIQENGITYSGKVESISIYEKEKHDHYIALAVTDNDDGASELLMLDIQL